MAKELSGMKVAVMATDGVEKRELTEPVRALEEHGADVTVLSLENKPIRMFEHHDPSETFPVDATVDRADPAEFQALVLPGGALNADAMRAVPEVLEFIRAIDGAGKPFAAICHAPWELISAGVVRGRTLTSFHTIKDDIVNAGGRWEDLQVCRDDNLVTSRKPDDLPAFNETAIGLIRERLTGARR